ncbi:hypothetical protein MMC07_003039 [Pseudocyphellaria aurata]|nr:hypothetical protein [Pseudocyphellaria aurata]
MGLSNESRSESHERLLHGFSGDSPSDGIKHNGGKSANRYQKTMEKAWSATTGILAIAALVLATVALTSSSRTYKNEHHHHLLTPDNPNPSTDTSTWLSCGSTSTEARSQGCRFDVMMSAWVHERCYDAKLMEQTLSVERFTWFEDLAMTLPVPESVVRLGNHHRLYTRPDFHYKHCAYVWLRQMRAWRGRAAIDDNSWDFEHTVHCAQSLLAPNTPYPKNHTENNVVFYRCGKPFAELEGED